ncbi:protein SPIRAL1-like 1 [Dioscorea cayenensis subsp. rotundata]|uniref:Protein SPIRAL1-like 1 n=1 Tax=Dioscorea cayennensis subsp. rotundata TaxID=55577 RepID=A0AB40BZ95_DIOCR|nr:protein SPIRAL1-like 1 [Dioscorea cayenensis subsp. rotundata]XP_039132806.1 protein SPIRAL1-like 1 [Dioscorea cayenensis subsp. rotundata]
MKRGVSSGGGQSSLSYLFGADEAPKPAAPKPAATPTVVAEKPAPTPTVIAEKPAPNPNPAAAATADKYKQIPAGIQGHTTNNYFRADGQNTGNFITDRPSTKVHAAPGGGSSLDYLFGGAGK